MEPNISNQKPKASAKDFFLNLGSIVALYTTVVSLLDLLFTVINTAFPQINSYNYYSSASISFPVATLIIFFPIYIVLMWLLEKGYAIDAEKRNLGVKKWLTYITLFIAGLTAAIDLVIVLRYFLNGNEITLGFIFKTLSVLIIAALVFYYYIEEIRNKLTSHKRKSWIVLSALILIASIAWGFAVLGSPRTQQLLKYDEQKVSDLENINQQVINFYQMTGYIPGSLSELASTTNYFIAPTDEQTGAQYGYKLIGQSVKAYQLCATFNKASTATGIAIQTYTVQGSSMWNHLAGYYCFNEAIPLSLYPQPVPVK